MEYEDKVFDICNKWKRFIGYNKKIKFLMTSYFFPTSQDKEN